MSLRSKMKTVLESSILDMKEKIVTMGLLVNGPQTIADLHDYAGLSRAVIEKICSTLHQRGYLDVETQKLIKSRRSVFSLNENLFEQHVNAEQIKIG